MTRRYRVHGLRVESTIRFAEPVAEFDGAADLYMSEARAAPVERIPDDAVVLRRGLDAETVHYEGRHDASGEWVIRAPGVASVTVRGDHATVQLDPAIDPELLPVIAGGMGMGFFLAVSGHLCLHASAVEVDGRAVALSAPSGCGKSTLIALAAAAGYPLVADDLLRVDLDATTPLVYRGASEIRLRPGAATLEQHWPDHSRITADGRIAVAPPRTAADRLSLSAIVLPVLDPERADVAVERVRPANAFAPLLTAPRILGWLDPVVVAREFAQLTELAARVPVYIARVPWRTPSEPSIGAAMIERVLASGLDHAE